MSSTSTSGAIGSVLVVDANVLISVLLRGKAAKALTCPRFTFFTTIRATWEAERYLPDLAIKLARGNAPIDEAALLADLRKLPVTVLPESFYLESLPRARDIMRDRDPEDSELLALTMRLAVPLWTNDHHFDGIPEIRTVTTAELLAALGL